MQIKNSDYNELLHDRYNAITIQQPFATMIMRGEKKYELRNFIPHEDQKNNLIICSSIKPSIKGYDCGTVIGSVDIKRIISLDDLTPEQWKDTGIDPRLYKKYAHYKYAWELVNPIPYIEYPVKGQLGIWKLIFPKDFIIPYPRKIAITEKCHNIIHNE